MALSYIQHETDSSGKKQNFIVREFLEGEGMGTYYYYEVIMPKQNPTASILAQLEVNSSTQYCYFYILNDTSNYRRKIVKFVINTATNNNDPTNIGLINLNIATFQIQSYSIQEGDVVYSPVLFDTADAEAFADLVTFSAPSSRVTVVSGSGQMFNYGNWKVFSDSTLQVTTRNWQAYMREEAIREFNYHYKTIIFNKPITLLPNGGIGFFFNDENSNNKQKYEMSVIIETEPV